MGRLKTWRYSVGERPWELPEPVTAAEHRALKDEALVMLILLAIGLVCVFAEPLMDAFTAMLGVR
jgi:pyrroline-5-carboxylate reductase